MNEIIDLIIKADGSAAIAQIKAVESALKGLQTAQASINQSVGKAAQASVVGTANPSGQSKSNPQANFQTASQQASSAARTATTAAQGIDRQTRALQNLNRELATAQNRLAGYQDRLQKVQKIANAPADQQRALATSLLGTGARSTSWSRSAIANLQGRVEAAQNTVNRRLLSRDSLVQDMEWQPESERRKFEARDRKAAERFAKNDQEQERRARKLSEQREREERKAADARARNDIKVSNQAAGIQAKQQKFFQTSGVSSRLMYDNLYNQGEGSKGYSLLRSQADQMNAAFDARRGARAAYDAERRFNQNMYAERRSNTDLAIAGAILGGVGYGAMQIPRYGLDQYDQYKKTMIGVQAVEGSQANNVMNQARIDASNMYGAGYRDVLNQQMLLRQSGQTTEQSRASVLALADINAGTGGNADRLQRNIYNLSQVEQQGKLTGRDLRDFAVNLVPIREALAKQMGVSNAEVADKVSRGEVTSDMVREALVSIAQDPRFKGRAAAISNQTAGGQWEKTQEEFQKTGEIIGESLTPSMIEFNKILRGIITFFNNNPTLTKGLGITAGAVGVAGIAGGSISAGRAGAGMLGQAFPALQKIPGIGGMFGEFGQKANTTATIANTAALNANTAALAGGGAADVADDLLGMGGGGKGGGKMLGKIGPLVAGLMSSPVVIAGAVALAAGVGLKLYMDLKNKKDEEKPVNDPNADNEIPGDTRKPGELRLMQQAQYQRDAAAQAKKEFNEQMSLLDPEIQSMIDPNDPSSWAEAKKRATSPLDRTIIDEAQGHWGRSRTALMEARRNENLSASQSAVPTVAPPPDMDFMNWSSRSSATVSTAVSTGSSGGGANGIQNIKENSDGSRTVTLLLPPDSMSRDLRQATRRR